jgi:hypothetical protein
VCPTLTRNPIIDGETRGADLLKDLGAKKEEVEQMRSGFHKLHEGFCFPPKLDDAKIKKVETCDPISKFPIGSNCRDSVYQGKTPNERRKIQCGPADQLSKMESLMDTCIVKELEKTKTEAPPPLGITEEEYDKLPRPEFIKLVLAKVGEMKSCFEAALK